MEAIQEFLMQFDTVAMALSILGSLVVVTTVIVSITPTKKDDKWLEEKKENGIVAWVLKFLKGFSLVNKDKQGKIKASNDE